jgi:Fur family transcriptional regulator, zinc uptake regulator
MTMPSRLEELVLAEIEADRGVVRAYGLAGILSNKLGRRIAPNSVYRVLETLMSRGAIRRVVSQNAFIASHDRNHILLICLQCGAGVEINDTSFAEQLLSLCRRHQFNAERVFLEVSGTCPQCSQ